MSVLHKVKWIQNWNILQPCFLLSPCNRQSCSCLSCNSLILLPGLKISSLFFEISEAKMGSLPSWTVNSGFGIIPIDLYDKHWRTSYRCDVWRGDFLLPRGRHRNFYLAVTFYLCHDSSGTFNPFYTRWVWFLMILNFGRGPSSKPSGDCIVAPNFCFLG